MVRYIVLIVLVLPAGIPDKSERPNQKQATMTRKSRPMSHANGSELFAWENTGRNYLPSVFFQHLRHVTDEHCDQDDQDDNDRDQKTTKRLARKRAPDCQALPGAIRRPQSRRPAGRLPKCVPQRTGREPRSEFFPRIQKPKP